MLKQGHLGCWGFRVRWVRFGFSSFGGFGLVPGSGVGAQLLGFGE